VLNYSDKRSAQQIWRPVVKLNYFVGRNRRVSRPNRRLSVVKNCGFKKKRVHNSSVNARLTLIVSVSRDITQTHSSADRNKNGSVSAFN
jgi:hypothetical protein